jgi:hypothetical protein
MSYGSDITEGIPYVLSNPSGATNYSATGVNYDMAIAGLPFFIGATDDSPYRRVTAQYRKQQYDQTREAGEQSLTGWWFRSQSSFHYGAGIKYFEPAQDESLRFQYTESKGIDVFTKGQATLLNSTVRILATANSTVIVGANDGTNDCLVTTSGSGLTKITMSADTPTTSNYTQAGTPSTILDLTTDGIRYYFINGTKVHQGAVTSGSSSLEVYDTPSTTSARIKYVKQRLIASINNSVYELSAGRSYSTTINNAAVASGTVTLTTSAVHGLVTGNKVTIIDLPAPFTAYNVTATVTAAPTTTTFEYVEGAATVASAATTGKFINSTLPAAHYTHPQTDWTWTTISEGPSAIYIGGFSRKNSSIYKMTLDLANANSLGFPELSVPSVVIDLPEGEIINTFDTYLGTYAMLCTNKGVRIGVIGDEGNISYGPLLFEAECKDVTFKDKFAYVSTKQDTESGLVRIDLSQPVIPNSLIFAYAWDVCAVGETATADSTAFLGSTDRVAFAVPGDGVWIESSGIKVESGYLQTGFIRYNTLEGKLFKLLNPRIDTTDGALGISSIAYDDTEYNIGSFAQEGIVQEIGIPYPVGAQEYLGFKFTLTRSSTDSSKGPLFTGYQLKSLPAVPRQRLIQYPLFCYDHESDNMGVEVGYEGSAYDRMSQLEAVENNGDTVRVEDFRTGESYIGLIEELDFINKTPSDRRFSGYGGMLIATIRLV